jgi:hypothetical protein
LKSDGDDPAPFTVKLTVAMLLSAEPSFALKVKLSGPW